MYGSTEVNTIKRDSVIRQSGGRVNYVGTYDWSCSLRFSHSLNVHHWLYDTRRQNEARFSIGSSIYERRSYE